VTYQINDVDLLKQNTWTYCVRLQWRGSLENSVVGRVGVDYKVPTTSVRELSDVNGTNVIYMTGDFEL